MSSYLKLEDALYIHQEQIRLFGGAKGVRDLGLIEAALLRPQTGYYDTHLKAGTFTKNILHALLKDTVDLVKSNT